MLQLLFDLINQKAFNEAHENQALVRIWPLNTSEQTSRAESRKNDGVSIDPFWGFQLDAYSLFVGQQGCRLLVQQWRRETSQKSGVS